MEGKSEATVHASFGEPGSPATDVQNQTRGPTPNREGMCSGPSDDLPKPLSVPEYLETHVMAVLTEGLEDLCRLRPANPIDHLALFLLRHSQSNTATEVDPINVTPVEAPKSDM
ncbi:hypothetical protein, conserved [Trypanosoma brucei gambiense DAL972]|uniref:Dpy-30 motif containing protein n=1 Tax=Trypanosoma brucei gambiense (strain MHOM/CI/86/DAL972) TaxID=679716 RepID=C9ZUI3_TRYB9|nr:hypothetical protein, conserved [Trypanosoma brucei gambiense DAL972]CBH13071.1 hypothetical protein, conserved [Trypanosoma brucei gambiense DAL972]|eukprot:XP_011775348.1 hypothetical protein, conserved [Trypanosoma brucei gambiense DAL972]